MEKRTLKFETLQQLTTFAKPLSCGYLINTKNLTITGRIPELHVATACDLFKAQLIETTEKVFSYDDV